MRRRFESCQGHKERVKNMNEKRIEFIPKTLEAEILVEKPVPASKCIPNWYKDAEKYIGGPKIFNKNDGKILNLGMKSCIPFLDTFLTGYIQKTWCDINIEEENGEIRIYQSSIPKVIGHRESASQLPKDVSYYPVEFTWKMQWIPKLPKGYSILYTHPINRFDLPFYSLTGIVDSDKFFYEDEANHPFLLKKGFNGLIPAGTPMVSIIPFKRDRWRSFFKEYNEKKQMLKFFPSKLFEGYYKKNMWSKKEFK